MHVVMYVCVTHSRAGELTPGTAHPLHGAGLPHHHPTRVSDGQGWPHLRPHFRSHHAATGSLWCRVVMIVVASSFA